MPQQADSSPLSVHNQIRRSRFASFWSAIRPSPSDSGWGAGFRRLAKDGVEVVNMAANGRSSKSFIDEGLWAEALDARGQYYLIQFGHNDEPGKGPERETDPKTTYRAYMARYVDESRAIGAMPILVTSLVRRIYNPDGTIRRRLRRPMSKPCGHSRLRSMCRSSTCTRSAWPTPRTPATMCGRI